MKKLLLGLVLLLPLQTFAADDSVYTWGVWTQGIKPAAGPVIQVAPASVSQPKVNVRETILASRVVVAQVATPTPPAVEPVIVTTEPAVVLPSPASRFN